MSSVELVGQDATWTQLRHLIRDRFPYCRMVGASVQGGVVVSFEAIRYTLVFNRPAEQSGEAGAEDFDRQWQRFIEFCRRLQNGVLGEVHFTDGRPILVSMEEPGRVLVAP